MVNKSRFYGSPEPYVNLWGVFMGGERGRLDGKTSPHDLSYSDWEQEEQHFYESVWSHLVPFLGFVQWDRVSSGDPSRSSDVWRLACLKPTDQIYDKWWRHLFTSFLLPCIRRIHTPFLRINSLWCCQIPRLPKKIRMFNFTIDFALCTPEDFTCKGIFELVFKFILF